MYLYEKDGRTALELLEDEAMASRLRDLYVKSANWRARRPLLLFFYGAGLMGPSGHKHVVPENVFIASAPEDAKMKVLHNNELLKQIVRAL